MLLADEERFRAKQGLFQSIGLYSIFGKKLVEHLWLLWELVLTGGPTLVVGSSVGASSAAILGMVRGGYIHIDGTQGELYYPRWCYACSCIHDQQN